MFMTTMRRVMMLAAVFIAISMIGSHAYAADPTIDSIKLKQGTKLTNGSNGIIATVTNGTDFPMKFDIECLVLAKPKDIKCGFQGKRDLKAAQTHDYRFTAHLPKPAKGEKPPASYKVQITAGGTVKTKTFDFEAK